MLSPNADVALAPLAGTDIVGTDEVSGSIARFGQRYLECVYTPAELATCDGAPAVRAARLAARFAAKEAAMKALDPDGPVGWRELEVLTTGSGRPELVLHGGAAELARRRGVGYLAVSLSHHGGLAHAVVVGWRSTAGGSEAAHSRPDPTGSEPVSPPSASSAGSAEEPGTDRESRTDREER